MSSSDEVAGESAALAILGINESVQRGSTSVEKGRELIHNATSGLSAEAKTVADRIVRERSR